MQPNYGRILAACLLHLYVNQPLCCHFFFAGNPKLWFGELDMLLCPHIGILQEPAKCAVQGNIFNVELKTCSSHHKIMVYSDYKTQLSHQTARFFSLPTGTKLSWRHSIMMEKVKPATKREFLPPLIL